MKNSVSESLQQEVIRQLLKEGLGKNQRIRLHVTSKSMAPLLRPGDFVSIKQVDPTKLKRGDLLVLQREPDLVIHRLIMVDREGRFHTKGDSLPCCDSPVTALEVLGKVVTIEHDQRVIDLTNLKWIRTNQIIGMLGKWEHNLALFNFQSRNLPFTKTQGQVQRSPADRDKESNNSESSRKLTGLLQLPLRFLAWIVLGVARIHFLRR